MEVFISASCSPGGGQDGWVGEFEQFDGRAVFDDKRDADAVGWAVGRIRIRGQQARRLDPPLQTRRAELADEIRDCGVRFETHPLHANSLFSWLTTRLSGVSSGSRQASLRSWEFRCDGTGALFFALRGIAQILRCRSRV